MPKLYTLSYRPIFDSNASHMNVIHIFPVDKVEEDEVGGTCGTNGGEEERV
jgi:hypothetical protein